MPSLDNVVEFTAHVTRKVYDPDQRHENETVREKVRFNAQRAFDKFRDFWAVGGKIFSGTRTTLKGVGSKFPSKKDTLSTPINGLGLATAVTIFIHPVTMAQELYDANEYMRVGDHEGAALSTVSATALAGDTLHSIMTFCVSGHEFTHKIPAASWFSQAFLPLGMILVATGLVTKGYKTYCTKQWIKHIDKLDKKVKGITDVDSKEFTNGIDAFVNEIAGITPKELEKIVAKAKKKGQSKQPEYIKRKINNLKKRKINRLKRRTSSRIVESIQSLKTHKLSQPMEKLRDIKTYLKRKVRLNFCDLTTNVVTLVALFFFFVAVLAPYIPLAVLAVAAIVKLALYIYENYYIENGLHHLNTNDPHGGIELRMMSPAESKIKPLLQYSRDPIFCSGADIDDSKL